MTADPERLGRALAAIDAANADDPNSIVVHGEPRPKELAHAELVSGWVVMLRPDASEALRLAARAHHVRRWEIARASFPADRAGYHRWRVALQAHHARIAGELLAGAGYTPEEIARVQDLVRKRGLGRDPEVQPLEDALCLVFLETQLADTTDRLGDDKMVDIIRKTAAKMSASGLAAAGTLPIRDHDRHLIDEALGA